MEASYPRISVAGSPRECGRQHGEAARERVLRSIDAYREVYSRWAGWDWDRVREEAAAFREPIEKYGVKYLEEISGIAEGAGVAEVDVLAINVRTEVIYAATAREAAAGRAGILPAECSSFAVMPSRSANGRMLIGQNWDWLSHASDTVVVLEVEQNAGQPNYVTVVEAGLLAKFGMNSCGIGLVCNSLVTDRDRGAPAVPFHVILRAILDCETMADALAAVVRFERAASANFVLAHEDGVALNIEASAGDSSQVWISYPEQGLMLHTNHFVHPGFTGRDISVQAMPDGPVRYGRLRELVAEVGDNRLDCGFFQRLLSDHAALPQAICSHQDLRLEEYEREETLASVVIDVTGRTMLLATGNPCRAPYETLDYSDLLSNTSSFQRLSLVGHS